MPRLLVALIALVVAGSATATTITLDIGDPAPEVGDVVTISLTVDTLADPGLQGAVEIDVSWDPSVGDGAPTSTQTGNFTSFGGGIIWNAPANPVCVSDSTCRLIQQDAFGAALNPSGIVIGTLDIEIIGVGPLNLQIGPTFSPTSLTPDDVVFVPEPGTAGLLALGLATLAVRRRRPTRPCATVPPCGGTS